MMFGKAVYDSFQKAKSQLAEDDIQACIATLLDLAQALKTAETSEEGHRQAGDELETQAIVYSASLQRLQQAFQLHLIDYDKNSQERNKIIYGILANIQGYVQTGKGMFTDPGRAAEPLYSVHIMDELLLKKQLLQLAENLDRSQRESR